jgi:hypothetical protein
MHLQISSSEITAGDTVTFTVALTSTGGIPSGMVNFYDSNQWIGSANLDKHSRASLTNNDLPAGSHTILAEYTGDANFNSTTANAQLTIQPSLNWIYLPMLLRN